MKLPTWFKVTWWVLITALTVWLFSTRLSAITQGQAAPVDVFVFLVLVALLLAPIFQEISFFGLKFKQAIEALEKSISAQLSVFKADIQTSITNTSNINVTIPTAPPDEALPDLEVRIRAAVSDELKTQGIASQADAPLPSASVDDDTTFLFTTRYTIERKLRHIASSVVDFSEKRPPPSIMFLTNLLAQQELLHSSTGEAIRQIYRVCSPAVHGEPVTPAQVTFVRGIAPQVIKVLTEIERRTMGST